MNIINRNKEISQEILERINSSDEVFIAISFITEQGLKYLIENSNLLKKKVVVVTTTENFITDHWVLDKLYKQEIETFLINKTEGKRSFHSKFIIFGKNGNYSAMVGSLNLTHNSFFNKYENVTFVDGNKYLEYFELMKRKGTKLTKEFIDIYENAYSEFIKTCTSFDSFKDNLEQKMNLKPNVMQLEVAKELLDVRKSGENRALLWSATGTGKTYSSAFDARNYDFKKLLFIVHNRVIMNSAKRDFDNIFFNKVTVELTTKNKQKSKDSDIVFTTEKTLNNIIEQDDTFLDQFDYVVFDEAHKLGSNNIQGKIFNLLKDRKDIFILAMTATPNRSDDPSFLYKTFKNFVGKIDIQAAIKKNLICKFSYYGVDVSVDFGEEPLSNNDLDLMINKFTEKLSNIEIWDKTKIKGLIFVKNTKEADDVAKKMTEKGYPSHPIHSKSQSSLSKIQEFIGELQDEKSNLNFLVTVNKFNEGIDIPKVNTIGMFRFTESSIIYIQQIGRGLRLDKGKDKILKIIDLVGNHKNSFERIVGINGSLAMNPKEILERVTNNDLDKNNILVDFDITEIAKEKILKSISTLQYKDYIKQRLIEVSKIYQRKVNLSNFVEELGEDIQVISNNMRKEATFNGKDHSWIATTYKYIEEDIENITKLEHQILELFSWMPLTVSNPMEKRLIIDLMKGKKVKLSSKWNTYFTGKNLYRGKSSNFVIGDFTNYFELEEELSFESPLQSKESINIFNHIIEYLEKNVNKNDKLSVGKWYSKAEISFIAGYEIKSTMKGKFGKYKDDKTFGDEEIFLTNNIRNGKTKHYSNEVISNNEFIVCDDTGMKGFKNPEHVHNFLGTNLFNNGKVLFKYVGKPKNISLLDTINTNDKNEKPYQRFSFNSFEKLENDDLLIFQYRH